MNEVFVNNTTHFRVVVSAFGTRMGVRPAPIVESETVRLLRPARDSTTSDKVVDLLLW